MFWNSKSERSSALLQTQSCIPLRQSAEVCPLFFKKCSSTCSSLSQEMLKFLLSGLYFKTNHSITKHATWSAVLTVMTFLSPFNNWEFSVSGETGNSLFSKDVYTPSIFLNPCPSPSQVFLLRWHPVLWRSYPHDRKRYDKIESCEQSISFAGLFQ